MSLPGSDRLLAALEATWPPLSTSHSGPFVLRDGAGGGKRVSAATLLGAVGPGDISRAEAAMAEAAQTLLFQVGTDQREFDAVLAARGYEVVDPTTFYAGDIRSLADPALHRLASIPCEAPLAIQEEIWAEGGIGPARLAVMARARGPKSYLLGRSNDTPAATAFVALDETVAMVHALETRAGLRRQGAGLRLMRGAANWAQAHGAKTLAVLVTAANGPANTLYASLGMVPVEGYHYRMKGQRSGSE